MCAGGSTPGSGPEHTRALVALGRCEVAAASSACEYPLVGAGARVRQVVCGSAHTIVLTTDDDVFVTGSNDKGQLGACDSLTWCDYRHRYRCLLGAGIGEAAGMHSLTKLRDLSQKVRCVAHGPGCVRRACTTSRSNFVHPGPVLRRRWWLQQHGRSCHLWQRVASSYVKMPPQHYDCLAKAVMLSHAAAAAVPVGLLDEFHVALAQAVASNDAAPLFREQNLLLDVFSSPSGISAAFYAHEQVCAQQWGRSCHQPNPWRPGLAI